MLNVDASFLNYNYDIDIPSFVRSFPGGLSFKNLKLSLCDFDLPNEKYDRCCEYKSYQSNFYSKICLTFGHDLIQCALSFYI